MPVERLDANTLLWSGTASDCPRINPDLPGVPKDRPKPRKPLVGVIVAWDGFVEEWNKLVTEMGRQDCKIHKS